MVPIMEGTVRAGTPLLRSRQVMAPDRGFSHGLLFTVAGMEGSKTSSSTMQVSFVCQRCSQPLKLDTSFKILDRVTIQELTGQRDSWKGAD